MITDDERRATIERIAEHLARFDDDTLLEMERLTDPVHRDLRPARATDLNRRQLLLVFAAGVGSMGLAALGLDRLGGPAAAADEELARLRALEEWSGAMEAVDLDAAVGDGLAAVGGLLAEVEGGAATLAAGLKDIAPLAVAAVSLVDPALAERLRQSVLEPAEALVSQVDAAAGAWSERLAQPVRERLGRRSDLRARQPGSEP